MTRTLFGAPMQAKLPIAFFAFGRPFQVIETFISEKNIAEDVHIAIPTRAIEELKDQKNCQYKTDIVEFQKLAKGFLHVSNSITH